MSSSQPSLEWHQEIFQDNQGFLVDNLCKSINSSFTSHLVERGIVTCTEETDLQAILTPSHRSWKLVNLLQTRGPREFQDFLDILRGQGLDFIASKLSDHTRYNSQSGQLGANDAFQDQQRRYFILSQAHEDLRRDYGDLMRDHEVLRRDHEDLRRDHEGKQERLDTNVMFLQEAQKDRDRFEAKVNDLGSKIQEQNEEIQKQKREIQRLQNENTSLSEDLNSHWKHTDAQEVKVKYENEIGSLTQAVNSLQSEMTVLERESTEMRLKVHQIAKIIALPSSKDNTVLQHLDQIVEFFGASISTTSSWKLNRPALKAQPRVRESRWVLEQKHKIDLQKQQEQWEKRLHYSNNQIKILQGNANRSEQKILGLEKERDELKRLMLDTRDRIEDTRDRIDENLQAPQTSHAVLDYRERTESLHAEKILLRAAPPRRSSRSPMVPARHPPTHRLLTSRFPACHGKCMAPRSRPYRSVEIVTKVTL